MDESIYTRTTELIGNEAQDRLKSARVIVFGVGGVGGYAVEALARAGVGSITVVDSDTVSVSNINRQIIAMHSTVGRPKVEVIKERIKDINPDIEVIPLKMFYSEENAETLDLKSYDFVLDCIDSVRSKLYLIEKATAAGTQIISSMGAGNKLDPTRFKVSDILKTHTDPLAKVIRTELRKRGIHRLLTVWSDEAPRHVGKRTPASISFVPSAAGLVMASEVVKRIARL